MGLRPGSGDFYVVRIEALADPSPPRFSEEELKHDPRAEIERLIDQMRDLSERELLRPGVPAVGRLSVRPLLPPMDRTSGEMNMPSDNLLLTGLPGCGKTTVNGSGGGGVRPGQRRRIRSRASLRSRPACRTWATVLDAHKTCERSSARALGISQMT